MAQIGQLARLPEGNEPWGLLRRASSVPLNSKCDYKGREILWLSSKGEELRDGPTDSANQGCHVWTPESKSIQPCPLGSDLRVVP